MDHQETIWISKEETDDVPDEPGSTFLEDPLKPEQSDLPIKSDPELNVCAGSSEDRFAHDPLGTSWATDYIKEEPSLNLEPDEIGNIMVASTRCASSGSRLHQTSSVTCGISYEETVTQGVDLNELEIRTEKSTCLMVIDSQTKGLKEKEEEQILRETRLKCSRAENEFHKFSCSFCLQCFSSKYRLIMHVFIHMDGVQPPTYVCKSCGEVFPSNISLNKHLKMNKDNLASSACHSDEDVCIYKHNNIFLEDNHDVSPTEQTDKQSSSQLKSQALRVIRTRSHKCDVCSKSFTRLSNLKAHSFIHKGISPYKCNDCGKSFTHLEHMKTHAIIHSGMRPHKCNVCGKSFTQLGNLTAHSLIHTGRRPHKCDVCGKSFMKFDNLKTHAVIHSGLGSHKCTVCGKSFTHSSHLKMHTLIHSGIRPHTCDVCGKSFTHLGNLNYHALIHSGIRPHKCDVCGKTFTRLGTLKRHALTHSRIRPT